LVKYLTMLKADHHILSPKAQDNQTTQIDKPNLQ